VEAQRQCPSQTPGRKSHTGLNPGTGVATAVTRHLLFLCVLSIFLVSFDWDTLALLRNEPESRLVERCNHYCLHSTVASASFLICFTDLWITLYIATNCNIVVFITVCIYRYIYTLQLCIIDITQLGWHTLRLETCSLESQVLSNAVIITTHFSLYELRKRITLQGHVSLPSGSLEQ